MGEHRWERYSRRGLSVVAVVVKSILGSESCEQGPGRRRVREGSCSGVDVDPRGTLGEVRDVVGGGRARAEEVEVQKQGMRGKERWRGFE